jgi:suppressor of ftsI
MLKNKRLIIKLGLILLVFAIPILIEAIAGGAFNSKNESSTINNTSTINVEDLEEYTPEFVELKNGDTYDLEAKFITKKVEGKELKLFGYNGTIPGPTIKVNKGDEITINFLNNTDVDSTIHSHGLRLDNEFDGVPDSTQPVVKPGETFTYKLKFPDEGIYWYHPHFREDYAQEMGLYGNYFVVSDNKDYWSKVNYEVPLIVDDFKLLPTGDMEPFDKNLTNFVLMGRYGNKMFLNGEVDYKVSFKKGSVARFYLTNVANTRVFNFKINGAKMKLVGGDNGKYEREEFIDSITIAPSERYIVEVLFDKEGEYKIENSNPISQTTLGMVYVKTENVKDNYVSEFNTLRENTDIIADIDKFRPYFDKTADKKLRIDIDMSKMMDSMQGMPCHSMGNGIVMGNCTEEEKQEFLSVNQLHEDETIEWEDNMEMMNFMSTTENVQWKLVDESTGKANMDIDWSFKVGDVVKIEIFNDPNSLHPMQHPIHLHGQRFLVTSINGEKVDNLVWKDSVLVEMGDRVEIIMDVTNPGTWMAHCHIAEHIEDGMMFEFKVNE